MFNLRYFCSELETTSVNINMKQKWDELKIPLSDAIRQTIDSLGFPYMTPVQVAQKLYHIFFQTNEMLANFDNSSFIAHHILQLKRLA